MNFRRGSELVELAGLTEKEREALELKFDVGYGDRTIMLMLGISRTSVKDRLASGLRKVERATRPLEPA